MKLRISGDNLPVCASIGRARGDLADVWEHLGYVNVAEIGVFQGTFSKEILTRNKSCHLSCIDPWIEYSGSHRVRTIDLQNQYFQQTQDNLKEFITDRRVTVIRKTSMDALSNFADGSLDAVFIDGDHTFDFIMLDIIHWSKKVVSGGMICVHDYCPMRNGGVIQAVDAYTSAHHIDPWYTTRELLPSAFWVNP
jgi:hypothetical protein